MVEEVVNMLDNNKASVVAINISARKGVIKTPINEGNFIENYGLENDAHAGDWHRQVSLLAQESVDLMKNDKVDLEAGMFAENITTQGIVLYELAVGTQLKIGESVQEVTQIGKECHSGCEIAKIVGSCIMPKQGIFTRVIKSGKIKVGDEISVIKQI